MDKIICGHALEVLQGLPDASVDCCITSPPYWGLRQYAGEQEKIWDGEDDCEHEWGNENIQETQLQCGNPEFQRPWREQASNSTVSTFCSKCNAWQGALGLEPTFQLYVQHLLQIFDEVKRVLKDTGTCWVNLGDSYGGFQGKNAGWPDIKTKADIPRLVKPRCFAKSLLQIPQRFSIGMVDRGWILRNVIIWHKPNCMPSSAKDRFTIDFEYVFFFVKNKKYYFEQQFEAFCSHDISYPAINTKQGIYAVSNNRNRAGGNADIGRNKRTVWAIPTQPFSDAHFAVFPEALIEPMVKSGCPIDGIVLDPFIGSGTTAIVAFNNNCHYLGIEISEEYCCMAEKRIAEVKQLNIAGIY